MIAPYEKLQAGGNRIVQVVVTRACDVHTCSNCTQLLPFRRDELHMSPACAEEALRSLDGWPGVVAMFGGNPTMHPQFPDLCRLWERYVPERQRGLWTNALRGRGPTVARAFPPGRAVFNLNVHGDAAAAGEMRAWLPGVPVYGESGRCHHAAMLVDYRDLGLPEAEWVENRERCDVNRKWSSAIYERDGRPYAYFCEVAGSLDGVRGENHGIPAVPGWWREPMATFEAAGQVRECCDRGCGVPLRAQGHQDTDAVYDVSAGWAERLEAQRRGRVTLNVLAERPPEVHEATDYVGFKLKRNR